MACGDALKLTFKLDSEGRIADAKFSNLWLCQCHCLVERADRDDQGPDPGPRPPRSPTRRLRTNSAACPDQKMHCSVMGMEALEAAIENHRTGKPVVHQEHEGHVVCTCFGVTDVEIERVIRDNDLDDVEAVTNYCKAGGGCGGCVGPDREDPGGPWSMIGYRLHPRLLHAKRPS